MPNINSARTHITPLIVILPNDNYQI